MPADVLRFRVSGLVLAAMTGACGGRSSEPAVIAFRSDSAEVTVPEWVTAGEQFVVSYPVFESGCRAPARTQVRVRGRTAEIKPRVGLASPDPCPAILSIVQRTATLRFDHPGEAVVSLVGVREGPPSDSSGRAYTRPVRVERRLRVLPAGR
jgi:hypothetical protein